MLANSLQQVLRVPVTGGAFSQARYKIKSILFSDLCTKLLSCYLKMNCKKRWKGFLVIALDGSMCSLPSSKEIEQFFGLYSTNKYGRKRYKCRLFMAYDVLNKYVLSAGLAKPFLGELTMMMGCIGQISGKLRKHIYVMDRNFDSFSTIKSVLQSDPFAQLCLRLSSVSGFYKKVVTHHEDDFVIVWHPSKKEKETCRNKGVDTAPIRIRVTKIMLSSGELEVLVSTLRSQRKYTKEDLYTLYGLRWGVEEGFKNLKPKMKLEYYGCKKVEGIYQEFYAHIFMMNMVALHGMLAQPEIEQNADQSKYRYTYNWKTGYHLVRGMIMSLFNHEADNITEIIERLVSLISKSAIPIKPGRHYPRDMRRTKIRTQLTHYNK